jgi:hypothetical protein
VEGVLLLADVSAVVLLVYWVVAYDTDETKAPSRGFFAFTESFKRVTAAAKRRRRTFQEQRTQSRGE